MMKSKSKKRLYLLVASLFLLSLACRVEAPRVILEDSPTPPPPPVITQIVTEMITPTPQPTSTPVPTSTPEKTATPTYDPLSAPIYYPLKDCAASRLHVGDKAMVSLLGGANAIRQSSDMRDGIIDYYAQPGEILNIAGGPECSYGWIVWLVETQSRYRGFTPEGDGNTYWLFPVGP
jgi:hypothetical protein